MGAFDCATAFLTGKQHDRYMYARPPKDGLPGDPPGALHKFVNGAYGLRAAPPLRYLRAKGVRLTAGLEGLQTAKACAVLRDPTTRENLGLLVLHMDDACVSGERARWEKALSYIRTQFTLGTEEYGTVTFLGGPFHQKSDVYQRDASC